MTLVLGRRVRLTEGCTRRISLNPIAVLLAESQSSLKLLQGVGLGLMRAVNFYSDFTLT